VEIVAIAGIDIGTTGCKCTIYDQKGNLISEAYREYNATITEKQHLLDAHLVWENTKAVLTEATKKTLKIEAIGVTSFGEAAILLDKNGIPLAPAMLYTDPRGDAQCNKLIEHFGKDYLAESTGVNPSPMYSISKLMWLKEQREELFHKCESICLFEDYIVYMLSGIRQIDYSLASRTMAFDINSLQWNEEILEYAGIDKKLFSTAVPIGSKAGNIRKELVIELGINEDAIIVSGCHDQIAAAIGTGAYKMGMAVDGTGTVECITPVFDSNIERKKLYEGSYAIVPFLDNNYVTYAFSFTGGALLKWYRDELAFMEAEAASKLGENAYEFFNEQVDYSKPSGLLVLPHFAGAATPYMDNESKGAIIGLTSNTKKSDIYQALMEGVTYEMYINIEKLSDAGINIDKIRATGGGASSSLWLQMKADILNKTVISLGAAQSGTLGCIMLAGLACGIYKSMEEAEKIFIKERQTYYPNSQKHEEYKRIYKKYKKLYSAVKSVLTA
jgi:Sugar (pentulose and hexulose) kinases